MVGPSPPPRLSPFGSAWLGRAQSWQGSWTGPLDNSNILSLLARPSSKPKSPTLEMTVLNRKLYWPTFHTFNAPHHCSPDWRKSSK